MGLTLVSDRQPLKDCPCCDARAELDVARSYRKFTSGEIDTAISIACTVCGLEQMICRADIPDVEVDEVIELWNRREPTR